MSTPAVVAATVNVLCELARRNPKNYLILAPQLFHLLTTSANNWMLIKIVKLV
jgi:AP-3 complex subunit delta